MVFDESVRAIVRGDFKPDVLRNALNTKGMRRLQDDALQKLYLGVTTLQEIQRVVPLEDVDPIGCVSCGQELLPAFQFCPYCGIRAGEVSSETQFKASKNISAGVLTS
jgi:hypothetical protein